MLVDTHCHIHEAGYPLDIGDVMARAHHAGISKMICVGTSQQSSEEALHFASSHEDVFASIGVHPHDAKDGYDKIKELLHNNLPKSFRRSTSAQHELQGEERTLEFISKVRAEGHIPPKIIAVGEIGLDYFYSHSPRDVQINAFETQLELATKHQLPVIFHVRDAASPTESPSVWDDFWPIFDNFQTGGQNTRGVLHSFTDTRENLNQALSRGLFIGLNGISTFTKDEVQKELFASIPLGKLLLETDAPFLAPAPHRGKTNEPAMVRHVAQYHADNRNISLEEIAHATSTNAHELFAI